MVQIGIKHAAWLLAERTCPYMQQSEESRKKLREYSDRHDMLKPKVIDELSNMLASYGYTLIAHAGIDTVEPVVSITAVKQGGSTVRIRGNPDILAVFTKSGDSYITITVEVKGTPYSALESASIYQAIAYSYIVYESRFPRVVDQDKALASRRLTPLQSPGLSLDFEVEAKMHVIDQELLSKLAPAKTVYYGLLAYKDEDQVNFMPVLSAKGSFVEAIDGISDALSEIIYPMLGIIDSREDEYKPGPWCKNCKLLVNCPVYSHPHT